MLNSFDQFIIATVCGLKAIRDNPTPAKIDNLLSDLQTLTLIQEPYISRSEFMKRSGYGSSPLATPDIRTPRDKATGE